ncbi:MAG: cyclic nucleotide-binding domain-containing protein [Gammaproteobacteria bacterium]|nr:cyclic nucleotide-binding domain-containing protein [Gammaproteobacteria bacterium]
MTDDSAVDPRLFQDLVPLGSLKPERQRDLARKAHLQSLAPEEFLFRRGDAADEALYLLEGELVLQDDQGRPLNAILAGQIAARHRIAHQSPRALSARCRTACRVLRVDAGLLDVMLAWDQTGTFEVQELDSRSGDSGDWMGRLLQMKSFQRVPPANLQAMFMRLQEVSAQPGEVIVKQGAEGDYFYVIVEGRCLVTREPPSGKAVRLAELESGNVFGEEALIADETRNATITALTPCRLMRLAKQDFRTLLDEPLSRRIDRNAAQARVDAGEAVWLDVRLPSEFQADSLPGSINLPLYMLRPRIGMLKTETTYVVVCDSGRRSSVAGFVLTQKGFDAYVLDGGLDGHRG